TRAGGANGQAAAGQPPGSDPQSRRTRPAPMAGSCADGMMAAAAAGDGSLATFPSCLALLA
ncbi:MAG: hypothetical protein ACK6D2_06900, partial [Planctomycetota bacterium]